MSLVFFFCDTFQNCFADILFIWKVDPPCSQQLYTAVLLFVGNRLLFSLNPHIWLPECQYQIHSTLNDKLCMLSTINDPVQASIHWGEDHTDGAILNGLPRCCVLLVIISWQCMQQSFRHWPQHRSLCIWQTPFCTESIHWSLFFFVWLWDIGIAATTGNIGYIWVSIDWVALYSLVRSSVRMVTSPFRDALLERKEKR